MSKPARAPRGSKRKSPAAAADDTSIKALIAEAARMHAEVYVDDASGTIHGPIQENTDAGLVGATSALESWGFREAYAEALTRSAAEVPDAPVDAPVTDTVAVGSRASTSAGVARSFVRTLAATWSRTKNRMLAAGARCVEMGQWYQQKRQAQLATRRLRVVETVSLGDKRFISVVRVDDCEFLVGGSATGVALLGQVSPGQKIASAGAPQAREQA